MPVVYRSAARVSHSSHRQRSRLLRLLPLILAGWSLPATATDYTLSGLASAWSSWSTWQPSGHYPNSSSDTANLLGAGSALNVNVDVSATV